MSRKILVLKLWPKKLSANQIARLLFHTLTKNNFKEFSEFLQDDSGDDSLPPHTNCSSRKILVLELWPKKLPTNQIAWLLFQTLTKNNCKEFSEFLHDDSGDDSLPSHTNCMSSKILVLELWLKKLSANQIAWLVFLTLAKSDCKEFSEFLHDDSRDDSLPSHTNCMSGKFWFLSYGPKRSRPIRLLDYFFRIWQRMTLRNFLNFYIMIVEMILYHHVQTAYPGKYWLMRLRALLSTTSNICSNCLIILIQYDTKVLYGFKYSIH